MLYLIAFIGGMVTIAGPFILPVLPFVFAPAGRSFVKSGLPLLFGMAASFAVVGSLASLAGDWIVRANRVGRLAAMEIFGIVGLALLLPVVADYLSRPFVRLGNAVQRGRDGATIGGSFMLGISAGLLWTPCAGPLLGLLLGAVAIEGTGTERAATLLAFAL